ncbi:asparagine synthase-related protein [Streptomyces tardus]|nr:asparagine synthase-related protein [Streptomyces tardus]
MLKAGVPFFVALPDTEAGRAVARHPLLQDPELEVHTHSSGRPWLITRPLEGRLRILRAGTSAVAVAGLHEEDAGRLERALRRLPDRDAFVADVSRLAGDFHVIAAHGAELLVRGTAYGVRAVHYTELEGCVVVSDRARVLAELTGADLDEGVFATHLMGAWTHALFRRPLWKGVRAVPSGRYLAVSSGRPVTRQWHRVPEPEVPLAEGARRLREELLTAVGLRVAGGGTVSADMSGGLDSTSIAFAAAQLMGDRGELILTSGGDSEDSEDLYWARRAAKHLPHVEHDVFHGRELPLFYEGLLDPDDAFDFPANVPVCRERAGAVHRRMAARGSRLHLSGMGGDQLFLGLPGHYHDLVLRSPLEALHRLRGYRVMFSWRRRDVLRALLDRRSYAEALRTSLPDPGTGTELLGVDRLAWFFKPPCPPWMTEHARELVADELRAAAATAEPLHPCRGRHMELSCLLLSSKLLNATEDMALRMGIRIETPYADDRVIDAALSVRIPDRATPYAYKQLIAEAMRGILPRELAERRTKLSGGQANERGLRHHRSAIAALWDGSELAARGLADETVLQRMSRNPNSREFGGQTPEVALNLEAWLRSTAPVAEGRQRATQRASK